MAGQSANREGSDPSNLLAVTRRTLLSGIGSAAALPILAEAKDAATVPAPPATVPVELEINGRSHRLALDPRTTLLDTLREHLGLTGSKKGCDHGQCGACTLLAGGKRVLSCMTLAVAVREPVTTIEGLASADGELHPMQQAFIEEDAFQCGYCTPGQILSGVVCVKEGHAGSDDQIREYMSGNLCRCAAYPHIVKAVKKAATRMERG